jgi:anti-sigma factor RsiW
MTCREFVDFLMDYLDGDLPRSQKLTFESHLQDCPECGVYLDTYRETVRLGKELLCPADDALPEEVPADLVEAILAARPGRE